MDFLGKGCMKSWIIILCIFLYGCASKQPSSYREISAQNFSKSNKYWHICKNQTLGDLDPINVHLGNEFVTQITTVYAGLKNKLIITDGDKLSTLELIAKPVNGNSTYSRRDAKGEVFLKSFQRNVDSSNDIYITIDSNATSGYIIPIPGLATFSGISFKRTIESVGKDQFDKFCGSTRASIFER